jgi:hypothetical protein
MKFLVEINMDNAAFDGTENDAWAGRKELSKLLRELADEVDISTVGAEYWVISDINGNKVLRARIDTEWDDLFEEGDPNE